MSRELQRNENRNSLWRKLIAMICLVAIWTFGFANSLQAAQPGNATGEVAALSNAPDVAIQTGSTGVSPMVIAVVATLALAATGYNLLASGKQGWGWVAICTLGAVLVFVGKLGLATFNEVSTSNSVADWDE